MHLPTSAPSGLWYVEVTLFALLCAVLLGHAALLRWRAHSDVAPLARGRFLLATALAGNDSCKIAEWLERQPMRRRLMLILEFSPLVTGSAASILRALIIGAGVQQYAEELCRDRAAARRLRGIRLCARLNIALRERSDWALLLADLRVDVRLAMLSWLDSLLRCACTEDESSVASAWRYEDIARAVRAAADDPRASVRRAARGMVDGIEARHRSILDGSASADFNTRLHRDLLDPQPRMRLAAIRTLRGAMDASVASAMTTLLSDPDWEVRREAGLTCRRLGASGVVLLRSALASGGLEAREIARYALELPDVDGMSLAA